MFMKPSKSQNLDVLDQPQWIKEKKNDVIEVTRSGTKKCDYPFRLRGKSVKASK